MCIYIYIRKKYICRYTYTSLGQINKDLPEGDHRFQESDCLGLSPCLLFLNPRTIIL